MAERARVLVREKIAEAGIDYLRERFDVDVDTTTPIEEIIDRYDGIVIRSATKLTAGLIEQGTRLRVIGRAGVGVDNVDVPAATRRGIVVANAPESTVVSAAEHALALLLAVARNVPQAHAALKEGRWERSKWGGVEVAGKTLAVLGFGRIGQYVARAALGLGMHVVAYDPFVGKERFRELGVDRVETIDEALPLADFISLHMPLIPETRRSIDAAAFAKMKDGVRIVNAARGELIDDDALIAAVESGKVAGAGLDVFSQEPYDGPLLHVPNIVVTPHLAASTDEAQDRAGVIVAQQVAAALEGDVVTNAVNIPVVGADDLRLLAPYVPLAQQLGRLAMELAGGRADRITVAYLGELAEHDTRLLTLATLHGALQGRTDQPVNVVNAQLVAAERGIQVGEERGARARFQRELRVTVAVDGREVAVAGTTVGADDRPWLSGALGFHLEIELEPRMAFFQYADRPGIIGLVGTLFGEAGVNIGQMGVSRNEQGGRALMALTIDGEVPAELVARVQAEGFEDVRFIELG